MAEPSFCSARIVNLYEGILSKADQDFAKRGGGHTGRSNFCEMQSISFVEGSGGMLPQENLKN